MISSLPQNLQGHGISKLKDYHTNRKRSKGLHVLASASARQVAQQQVPLKPLNLAAISTGMFSQVPSPSFPAVKTAHSAPATVAASASDQWKNMCD